MGQLEDYIIPASNITFAGFMNLLNDSDKEFRMAAFWDFERKGYRSYCGIDQKNPSYFDNDRHLIVQVEYRVEDYEIEDDEDTRELLKSIVSDVKEVKVKAYKERIESLRSALSIAESELDKALEE